MSTLNWAPRARQDLVAIWSCYAARNPDAADRLLDEISASRGRSLPVNPGNQRHLRIVDLIRYYAIDKVLFRFTRGA